MDEKDIVVYEDEGFSTKNLERPVLKLMIADSKKTEDYENELSKISQAPSNCRKKEISTLV